MASLTETQSVRMCSMRRGVSLRSQHNARERWQSDGKHHRKKNNLLNDEHENIRKTRRVSLQQLYAVIAVVAHDDAPLAVD